MWSHMGGLALFLIRVEQTMHMHDEITHLGVVDGALRGTFPGVIGLFVIRKNADDVEIIGVFELGAAEILEFAAEYEMQKLLGWSCRFGHWARFRRFSE